MTGQAYLLCALSEPGTKLNTEASAEDAFTKAPLRPEQTRTAIKSRHPEE